VEPPAFKGIDLDTGRRPAPMGGAAMIGMHDFPKLRCLTTCPLCGNTKLRGLITCWPCYRKHGLRHGNPMVERVLAGFEREFGEGQSSPMDRQPI
jgi:hypothetical protein